MAEIAIGALGENDRKSFPPEIVSAVKDIAAYSKNADLLIKYAVAVEPILFTLLERERLPGVSDGDLVGILYKGYSINSPVAKDGARRQHVEALLAWYRMNRNQTRHGGGGE